MFLDFLLFIGKNNARNNLQIISVTAMESAKWSQQRVGSSGMAWSFILEICGGQKVKKMVETNDFNEKQRRQSPAERFIYNA